LSSLNLKEARSSGTAFIIGYYPDFILILILGIVLIIVKCTELAGVRTYS
jgi:hypothetical protein